MKKKPSAPTLAPRPSKSGPGTPPHRPVHFTFKDPEASSVCLAGTFNDWHPAVTPMVSVGGGQWIKTLELQPGMHEYLFVVDGRWVADPGSAITVSNPFGGINCCVNVR